MAGSAAEALPPLPLHGPFLTSLPGCVTGTLTQAQLSESTLIMLFGTRGIRLITE